MHLRLLTGVACALALLCVVAPVSAHHEATVSATVTSLTLASPKCASYERRPVSRCDGSRRASVSWSVTCGARPFVTVDYWATRKGGGSPISLASEDGGEQFSGTTTTIVPPGARVYATVTVECVWDDPEGTGPEAHTVTRESAPSAEVVVRPWLQSVSVNKGNYCNLNPGSRTLLQAGQRGSIVSFSSDFIDKSLLGVGRRRPAGVRHRWVNVKGPRLRVRRHPEVFLIQEFGRKEPFSGLLRVNPRRAGWHKFWEVVGGVRTNTLAIKAVPNRC
jgi:hypothetical protein